MDTELLTSSSYQQLITQQEFAAVLFDAPAWDNLFKITYPKWLEAKKTLGDRVGFGLVDIDQEISLAKSIPIANVPTVVYFRNGIILAALIGAGQSIEKRMLRVMAAQQIGYHDGL